MCMSDLVAKALSARRYENADPATTAEIARNAEIATLDRLVMQAVADLRPGSVLQLRSGTTG